MHLLSQGDCHAVKNLKSKSISFLDEFRNRMTDSIDIARPLRDPAEKFTGAEPPLHRPILNQFNRNTCSAPTRCNHMKMPRTATFARNGPFAEINGHMAELTTKTFIGNQHPFLATVIHLTADTRAYRDHANPVIP